MRFIAQYQMSVFGQFMHISPDVEIMNKLLNTLSTKLKFLPGTINVVSSDVLFDRGVLKQIPRIQMTDEGGRWRIVILPDRIDVNYDSIDSTDIQPFSEISNIAKNLLLNTLETLKLSCGRIAINFTCLLPSSSKIKINQFYTKIVNPFKFQQGKDIVEWQIVSNSPSTTDLSKNQNEPINLLTNIALFQTNEGERVGIIIDINTSAVNLSERFSNIDVNEFYSYAFNKSEDICNDIMELWKND